MQEKLNENKKNVMVDVVANILKNKPELDWLKNVNENRNLYGNQMAELIDTHEIILTSAAIKDKTFQEEITKMAKYERRNGYVNDKAKIRVSGNTVKDLLDERKKYREAISKYKEIDEKGGSCDEKIKWEMECDKYQKGDAAYEFLNGLITKEETVKFDKSTYYANLDESEAIKEYALQNPLNRICVIGKGDEDMLNLRYEIIKETDKSLPLCVIAEAKKNDETPLATQIAIHTEYTPLIENIGTKEVAQKLLSGDGLNRISAIEEVKEKMESLQYDQGSIIKQMQEYVGEQMPNASNREIAMKTASIFDTTLKSLYQIAENKLEMMEEEDMTQEEAGASMVMQYDYSELKKEIVDDVLNRSASDALHDLGTLAQMKGSGIMAAIAGGPTSPEDITYSCLTNVHENWRRNNQDKIDDMTNAGQGYKFLPITFQPWNDVRQTLNVIKPMMEAAGIQYDETKMQNRVEAVNEIQNDKSSIEELMIMSSAQGGEFHEKVTKMYENMMDDIDNIETDKADIEIEQTRNDIEQDNYDIDADYGYNDFER